MATDPPTLDAAVIRAAESVARSQIGIIQRQTEMLYRIRLLTGIASAGFMLLFVLIVIELWV